MTQKQYNDAIIAINNLRDYLIEQHIRIKDLEHYLYSVKFMNKAFDAEEAIDVILQLFNRMDKDNKHEHAPAFNVVVKFLCRLK